MTIRVKFAIACVVTLWASAFVGIKAGLHEYSPEGLASFRYLISALVIGFIYFSQTTRSKIPLIDKIGLLCVGAIGIGVYNLTLNYGELSVSSGMSGFIVSQAPMFTTLFAVFLLGEELSWLMVAGFLTSIVGVTLIAAGELGAFTFSKGLLYLLIATLAGSLYSILQKPYMKKYRAIEATTYVMWGGALFLLLCSPHVLHDVMHASLSSTMTVIYLGVFPAAIAYALWAYVLSQIPVSQAASFLYTTPFIVAALAWAVLGEMPTIVSTVGALFAVFGVWIVNHSYKAKPKDTCMLANECQPAIVAE